MKIDTSIEHISAKSPNVSPMDHCAFVLLKRALSKYKSIMIDGLWKAVEWKSMPLEILRKALTTEIMMQTLLQKQEYQTEYLRK